MRRFISTAAAIWLIALGTAWAQEAPPAAATETAPATGNPNIKVLPDGSTVETVPAPPAATAGVPVIQNIPAMTGPQILIATSMGDITLQLDFVRAPQSTDNIIRYVRSRHYDGTVFYRVAKGFVVQMGNWDAKMKGRPVRPGPVPLESANGLSNVRGTVALAHGDAPDSAGPDFFINVGDNTGLDRTAGDTAGTTGFAVFGKVIAGMEVVDAISAVPVGDGGPMAGQWPLTPIVIKKVSIVPGSDSMLPPEKKAAPRPAAKGPAKKK